MNNYFDESTGGTHGIILIGGANNPTTGSTNLYAVSVDGAGVQRSAPGRGAHGFDIITSTDGTVSSSVWYALKAVDGSASIKASSSIGDDFTSNGVFTTGNAMNVPEGSVAEGRFIAVDVASGTVQAFRE